MSEYFIKVGTTWMGPSTFLLRPNESARNWCSSWADRWVADRRFRSIACAHRMLQIWLGTFLLAESPYILMSYLSAGRRASDEHRRLALYKRFKVLEDTYSHTTEHCTYRLSDPWIVETSPQRCHRLHLANGSYLFGDDIKNISGLLRRTERQRRGTDMINRP